MAHALALDLGDEAATQLKAKELAGIEHVAVVGVAPTVETVGLVAGQNLLRRHKAGGALGYLVMDRWLARFACIDLNWTIFALSGAVVLTVAVLTMLYGGSRAAAMQPTVALRNEEPSYLNLARPAKFGYSFTDGSQIGRGSFVFWGLEAGSGFRPV